MTVFHNEENRAQSEALHGRLAALDPEPFVSILVDNRPPNNRGFSAGCNLGAAQGESEFILFLNPDARVTQPILGSMLGRLRRATSIVASGEQFGMQSSHWRYWWGCHDWVCGACMMIRRSWFDANKGFDEGYVWGWEETDLIRRIQKSGFSVSSIKLPGVQHGGDWNDSSADLAYKQEHLRLGSERFYAQWGRPGRRRR